MAEGDPIPPLSELNWFGDLTLYQHPPCMFVLWYLTLAAQKVYEIVSELLGGGDGGDGGGGGGGGGGKDKDTGDKDEGGKDEGGKDEGGNDEQEAGGEEPAEEPPEEPPPEEEAA